MAAGIPACQLGALTNAELAATLRAAATGRRRDHELAVTTAWSTAALLRRKEIPLDRLLRPPERTPAAEQAEILADVAAADAEFDRLEAEARAKARRV